MNIQQIKIKNFKAFRAEEVFDFKGKNVLIYGNNGSGKSSLFWAIYTFLQSSAKPNDRIQKYFKYFSDADNTTHQSLLNIFEGEAEDAYIEITIGNENGPDKTFKISHDYIDTNQPITNTAPASIDNTVQLFNLSSDFINYKLLHNFYSGSHKYEVNLWPVFEHDIFPFFMADNTDKPILDRIRQITHNVPKTPKGYDVSKGSWKRNNFNDRLEQLNTEVSGFLFQVQENANAFIKDHFFDGKDVIQVQLDFTETFTFDKVRRKLWEDGKEHERNAVLRIKLTVRVFDEGLNDWRPVHRVQSFLNEAQLTRIAIGIRVGALQTRPNTEARVLVLDDMLISLDMSNRMKVIKMILNHQNKPGLRFFDHFQKIILTHDRGFYNITRNYTSTNSWQYYKLDKNENVTSSAPRKIEDKDYIEKAKAYLEAGEFETCGNELRKEAERILTRYLNPGLNELNEEFQMLSGKIKSAFEKLSLDQRRAFERLFVKKEIPVETLKKIEGDIDADTTLAEEDKQKLKILKKELFNYLYKQYEVKEKKEDLIANTKDILDRVMNPASHASEAPLYESELREAIEGVQKLKTFIEGL